LYYKIDGKGSPLFLLSSGISILIQFPISCGFRLFFLCLFSCRLLAQGRRQPFGGLLLRKAVAGWALKQSPLGTSSKGAGARLALASIRGHRLAPWPWCAEAASSRVGSKAGDPRCATAPAGQHLGVRCTQHSSSSLVTRCSTQGEFFLCREPRRGLGVRGDELDSVHGVQGTAASPRTQGARLNAQPV